MLRNITDLKANFVTYFRTLHLQEPINHYESGNIFFFLETASKCRRNSVKEHTAVLQNAGDNLPVAIA